MIHNSVRINSRGGVVNDLCREAEGVLGGEFQSERVEETRE
jgi:hypothetical protein